MISVRNAEVRSSNSCAARKTTTCALSSYRAPTAGSTSILRWRGAGPEWLISLSQRYPTETLTHSYRLPAAIHALGDRIIGRNRNRIAKEYEPNGKPGLVEVLSLPEVLDLLDGSRDAFVLARNR